MDIGFYFKLLSHRFPAMAALFLLCSCIGVVVALRLPTTYESSATLLVEPAQISNDLVRGASAADTSRQLEEIQQRLLTRANLINVARTARVFRNQSQMNPDVVVAQMRQMTTIRRSNARDQATIMRIGFKGENPEKVTAVVNEYVNLVLEVNSDFRTARAEGTLEFFQQEVESLSQSLDAQSAKILEFKSRNADALPENLDYRLNRQSLLQERLARVERDLEALATQRSSIERIYESTGRLETVGNVPLQPEQVRLRTLEGELRVALSVYSETNPRVKLLRNQIEALQKQMVDLSAGAAGEEEASPPVTALEISLSEIDARVTALNQEMTAISAELKTLEESIDRTPASRIELNAMERDQENLQALYSAAVQRVSQARMGERIETSSKGERITVLEPANVPNTPSGPNRAGIAGLGVLAGLGMAGGLFVLLELLNQTIRRPSEITRALEITPLAVVPRYETVADRRRRRIVQLTTMGIVITLVLTVLWAIDTYYIPVDQLFQRIVNRLR